MSRRILSRAALVGAASAVTLATASPALAQTATPPTGPTPTPILIPGGDVSDPLPRTYQCAFPLVGSVPLTLDLNPAFPRFEAGSPSQGGSVEAIATLGAGTAPLAASLEGSLSVKTSLSTGTTTLPLPITVPLPRQSGQTPLAGRTVAPVPSFTFPTAGLARYASGAISLNLTARDAGGAVTRVPSQGVDSDGNPDTFDVPCYLASEPSVLIKYVVVNYASTPTPTPTDTPTPTPVVTPYAYGVSGSVKLKQSASTAFSVKGGLSILYSQPGGTLTGDLTFARSQVKVTAYGFLPLVAKLDLLPTGPVSGYPSFGGVAIDATVRVKVPSVTLFGVNVGGGSACQTKTDSYMSLRSSSLEFDPTATTTLNGLLPIDALTGCGSNTSVISPLIAGQYNQVSVKLTPTA